MGINTIADVENLGTIVQAYGDFAAGLEQLKEANARLISPRDEALARLATQGEIGRPEGTRTCAGIEYAPGKLPILNLKSRLNSLRLARRAVEANMAGKYFSTGSTRAYENSLKKAEEEKSKPPKDRTVMVLPSRKNFAMNAKTNPEVLEMALKDQALKYLNLNSAPITFYLVDPKTVDGQPGTLLTQLWFSSLDRQSAFSGRGSNFGIFVIYAGCNYRASRGVLRKRTKSAAGAQKILEDLPYTQRDIDAQLRNLEKIARGEVKISDLEGTVQKVIQFLNGLKQ